MATVTVLKFAEVDGAEKALGEVRSLQKEHLIKVHDAAIVSWPHGKKGPIDDDFIKRVRGAVTEGTSALFLMTSDAVLDRVSERMKKTNFEVIATNLSKEQEDKLRDVFGS